MTMRTATRTKTRTATRTWLIRLQLEVAARRLTANPDRLIEGAIRPGLEEGFLERLNFYAIDGEGVCHARLSLGVDWDKHHGLVATSAEVRVPAGWADQVSPEVHVAVELFQEVVEEVRATDKVHLVATAGTDRLDLSGRFGFNPVHRPKWATTPTLAPLPVRELPELLVEFMTTQSDS